MRTPHLTPSPADDPSRSGTPSPALGAARRPSPTSGDALVPGPSRRHPRRAGETPAQGAQLLPRPAAPGEVGRAPLETSGRKLVRRALLPGILRPPRPPPREHLAPPRDWHSEVAGGLRPVARPKPVATQALATARPAGADKPRPTLDVSDHAYTDEEFSELLALVSQRVRALQLGGNQLTGASLAILGRAWMPRLTTLVLYDNPIDRAGWRALAGAHWPMLQRLDLRGCGLTDADVETLARGRLRNLRALRVADNRLTGRSTALLASGQSFAQLELLDLARNPLGNAGLFELFGGVFRALSSLDLADTGGNVEAVRRLVVYGVMPELRRLDLSHTPLPAADTAQLARRFAGQLRALALRHCRLDGRATEALLAPSWPALVCLDVDDNPLRTRGLSAVVEARRAGRLPRMTRLLVPSRSSGPKRSPRLFEAVWAALDVPYRRRRRALVETLMPVLAVEPPRATRRVRLNASPYG